MGKANIKAIFLFILFFSTQQIVSEPYQNIKLWGKRIALGIGIVTIPTILFLWTTNPAFKKKVFKMALDILPEPGKNSILSQSTMPHNDPIIPPPSHDSVPQEPESKKSQTVEKKQIKPVIPSTEEITPSLLKDARSKLHSAPQKDQHPNKSWDLWYKRKKSNG